MTKTINNDAPFVSLIMPVRNETTFINRSLGALLAQTYPKELMEIVIADGMSIDDTREKIEVIKTKTAVPIMIIDNPQGIAPTGLNRALEKTRGDIIIRIDGHCEIEPDYVANCVTQLQAKKADGVGGPIQTIGETRLANVIAAAMSSKFGVGGSAFRTVENCEMYTDTVAFPAYTRSIIEKAGKFNEELVRNQDDEYNYRIRKLGGKILLSPDIRSRYYSRSTFKSLWRQYFQYGFWKVRVLQMHPRQMSFRQFVPFAFVGAIISMTLLATVSATGRWALIFLIGSYLLANLTASLITSFKIGTHLFPLLSLSFCILHVSYGLGFLVGLISFRKKWK